MLKETYGVNSYYYQISRNKYCDLLFLKGDHDECIKIYDEVSSFLNKNINKENIRIA